MEHEISPRSKWVPPQLGETHAQGGFIYLFFVKWPSLWAAGQFSNLNEDIFFKPLTSFLGFT